MIGNFFGTHPFAVYAAMACLLALSGYGFSRVAPGRPLMAIGSWAFALIYLAFGLARVEFLSPLGPILALAVVVSGVVWLARYYERHRPNSS